MGLFSKKKKVTGRLTFDQFRSSYNDIAHGDTVIIEEIEGDYYTRATFARELEETTYRYSCNIVGDIHEENGRLYAEIFKL